MNNFRSSKMKKLMAILVFAGVLSVPSAVFAEASWYGSLRAGLKSSDSKVSQFDGGSRWGIKGSHEAGEGLSAVYRFEHKMSTENASQPGGRLAYVGLSGGFGTVTAGQIWSASYNSFGAVTDNSWFWGDAQTAYRHGNAISYAFSNDLMSLQLDGRYGGPEGSDTDPDTGLQDVEFGLSVNIADIGKVALSHQNDNYTFMPRHLRATGETPQTAGNTVYEFSDESTWETKTNSIAAEISVSDLTVYVGTQTQKKTNTTGAEPNGYTDLAPIFSGDSLTFQQSLSPNYVGMQPEGYEITQTRDGHGSAIPDSEQKTTFFGIRGGLGDTGLSYVFQWRDVKDSHKPWLLSLTKGLGDSASLIIEHANNDDNSPNVTGVALAVHF